MKGLTEHKVVDGAMNRPVHIFKLDNGYMVLMNEEGLNVMKGHDEDTMFDGERVLFGKPLAPSFEAFEEDDNTAYRTGEEPKYFSFVSDHTCIHDPFVSDCGRFEVDPLEERGQDLVDALIELIENHK